MGKEQYRRSGVFVKASISVEHTRDSLLSLSPWQRSGSIRLTNRRSFQTVCRDHYAITDEFAVQALGARLCEALYVDPDATSRYDETQPSRMHASRRRQQKHQKHGLPHRCTFITINSDATRSSVVFASRSKARSPASKENIGSSRRSLYFPNLPPDTAGSTGTRQRFSTGLGTNWSSRASFG
jgi:hypothetical protein